MYEFLDRLIAIVLPRVRDFRGLKPNAFDGAGNYNLGLSEQMVFPEVDADSVKHQQGLNITIVTTAKTNAEAKKLLEHFGMPFQKPEGTGKGAPSSLMASQCRSGTSVRPSRDGQECPSYIRRARVPVLRIKPKKTRPAPWALLQ